MIKMVSADMPFPCAPRQLTVEHLDPPPSERIQRHAPSLSHVENSQSNESRDRYTPAVTEAIDGVETYRRLDKRDVSNAPPAGMCIAHGTYLADLERALSWLDWSKLERWQGQPAELLQALAYRDQQTIPAAFWHNLDPRELVDEGSFDKAAFVYARLMRDQTSALTASSDMSALDSLRRMFRTALRQHVDKQERLAQLAAPPEGPGSTALFYDGLAWRNAAGKSFDELVQAIDWQRVPGGNAFSTEQKHALLQEKFTQCGESSQYSIGTPEQSLASTVQRILSYQRQPVPARFESEQQLIECFVALERDWERTRDYPIHPRLLFALHLARSSGVELRPTRWRESFWQQHLLPRLVERVKAGDIEALTWLVKCLGLQGDPAWLRKLNTPDPSALPALLDALADTTRTDSALSAQTLVSETFAELLRQQRRHDSLRELAGGLIEQGLGKEVLEGDGSAAYARAALRYAGERLLAVGGDPPKFERRRMAETILRRYGLTENELSAPRHYTLASANPNLAQSKFGSRVDEFLARADWGGVAGKTMVIARHTVNPQDELQRAEEAFNRDLLSHPWVRAKAKENLRAARVILTQRAINEEIQRLQRQYQAETESQRAWKRGIETWLNTVPVLGPIYNIEEGIRHQFPLQAILGVISLGLDAFDLVSGGGGRHPSARRRIAASLPSRDRNVLATVNTLRETIRLPALELDARVVINHDVLGISALETELPTAQRVLAQQARAGDAEVSWHGNAVVYLRNEARVALVKEHAGRYEEIDWLSGLPRESQRTIFREGVSSGYYSAPSYRTQADRRLSLAQTEIRGDKIVDRFTVQTVTALIEGKQDLSLRSFEDIFARYFTLSPQMSDAQRFDCRAFYQRLYERSHTFRRLVNGFDTPSGSARPWSIVIDDKAARVGSTYRAFTNFELQRIVVPSDEGIRRMTYMSVDGVKAVQPEQVYLHEMLHALTGAHDPARQLDLLNRGPIVYLTDKILSEADYRIPPQVMYRREDRLSDLPSHETVAGQREAAAHAMVIEDLYLDRLVDGIATPNRANDFSSAPTSQSFTLRQHAAVVQALANYRSTARSPVIVSVTQRLCKQFGLNEQDGSVAAHAYASQAVHFYRRLYEKSTTFRHLFDNYTLHAYPEARWHYVWQDDQRVTSGIERDNHTIYLLNDDSYYLTDEGVLPIEWERKLTYYMLKILLLAHSVDHPDQQAKLDRGAAVYFTDKILHEAGYHFPQQLSAQMATSKENAHYSLLRYHSVVRRIAASEQAYLT